MQRDVLAAQLQIALLDRDARVLCAAIERGSSYETMPAEKIAETAVAHADALLAALTEKRRAKR